MKFDEYESNQGNAIDSESPCNESRRAFFKTTGATILAAPAILTSRKSMAQQALELPPSPPTRPWRKELPEAIEPLEQTDLSNDPFPPQGNPNIANGECGRNDHQRWAHFFGDHPLLPDQADTYEFRVQEIDHEFHPDYVKQRVWNYVAENNAINPTIHARYGRPVILRQHNDLPLDHSGFGTPEVSLHLHNLHTPSESDGFPGDYFSAAKAGPTLTAPGRWKDHFYPNVYAGYDEFPKSAKNPVGGDYREALGTLWYHDHCLDFTAANATRGMAGFYILYDELDSGDEHDPNPKALRLPSHDYDYTLAFQDKRFDADTIQIHDQFDPEGTLGDKVTVNGVIEPVLKVASRKYRLRFLNAGPTRFYRFHLMTPNNVSQPFTHIANDGNLLPRRLLNRKNVQLGVAERADIVVDFSKYPLGTELYLVNRWEQTSTRGPKRIKGPGMKVLKIIVDRVPDEPDVSQVPFKLRPIRRPTTAELAIAPVRKWRFVRKNGMWAINGKFMNALSSRANMAKGSFEIWELDNPSGGWSHPVHIHFEEGLILNRYVSDEEVRVPGFEKGRKDVYRLGPNEKIRLFMRFRDFTGKYVMHCHNMVHEDHAMMIRWDIVG
ncbi:multicopper oxidase family protein [Nitrosomonas supralitoralis]|uniref:Bilirubin oxidase n=1 Tax=Nitrosomonas supralitoralis TaxID=2116706 RepID=A0A2P7NT28_9PROT|nr:multicopper oxidase domain-containing protein [Nitrosomonas supralitoralis]PSJ16588.1 bilirubin oxidase [Nitrosomonas supralitoralis]